ncbi:MAG TPA: hypothetical protein ENK75_06310 [Saprospiraceae bacterium]|nr:hypothetical protein [Saprospiraceae bacterium]HHH54234.1 hypothetical protein [Bacteroidota bacterium]
MKRIIILAIISIWASVVFAQDERFEVQVSNDTVLAGNYMIVQFDIINTNGDFTAPDFEDFDILSGPNTSSVFSMVNGQTTQKSSYTYFIEPKHEGELYIEPAYLYNEQDTLETSPIKIIVLPNPEGKKIEPKLKSNQNEFSFPSYGNQPFYKEKKRKAKKKKKKFKTRKL